LSDNVAKRIYWQQVPLFQLVDKVKLWPSRKGVLHGIKSFEKRGQSSAYITTHCNKQIVIRNSKNCRAARWLRNKWYAKPCDKCKVPQWKIDKFSETVFKRGRMPAYLMERKQKADKG